jgi:hypothetical protein
VAGATGTFASVINDSGIIAGGYLGARNAERGFVRTPDGTIATVGFKDCHGLFYVADINDRGVIIGSCVTKSRQTFGYMRRADGTLHKFAVPGGDENTVPQGINAAGVIAGFYGKQNTVQALGFLRTQK